MCNRGLLDYKHWIINTLNILDSTVTNGDGATKKAKVAAIQDLEDEFSKLEELKKLHWQKQALAKKDIWDQESYEGYIDTGECSREKTFFMQVIVTCNR